MGKAKKYYLSHSHPGMRPFIVPDNCDIFYLPGTLPQLATRPAFFQGRWFFG
jgi:hypothetical protein